MRAPKLYEQGLVMLASMLVTDLVCKRLTQPRPMVVQITGEMHPELNIAAEVERLLKNTNRLN